MVAKNSQYKFQLLSSQFVYYSSIQSFQHISKSFRHLFDSDSYQTLNWAIVSRLGNFCSSKFASRPLIRPPPTEKINFLSTVRLRRTHLLPLPYESSHSQGNCSIAVPPLASPARSITPQTTLIQAIRALDVIVRPKDFRRLSF